MLTRKNFIFAILLALASVSFLTPHQQVMGQFTSYTIRLDPDKTNAYVKNLINSYNLLVDEYDKPRPDFNTIKPYFSLYHETGNSFRVIIIQTDRYDTDWLSMIFVPIRADQPNVIIDQNNTFRDLFPDIFLVKGEYYVQQNFPFTYNNTTIRLDYIFSIYAHDISSDYITNSNDAAKNIYDRDQKQVPTVSQTQTVSHTVSLTHVTTIQSGENPIGDIISNPLSIPITVLGVVGFVVFYLVPSVFGSWADLVDRLRKSRDQDKIGKKKNKQQDKASKK